MRRQLLLLLVLTVFTASSALADQVPTFAGGDAIVSVESAKRDGNSVNLTAEMKSGNTVPMRIDVLNGHLTRVRIAPDGKFGTTLPEKDGFIKAAWPGAEFEYEDTADAVTIAAPGFTLRVNKGPFRISFRQGEKTFTALSIEDGISFNDQQARLSMESPEREKFFGFGDQGSGWRPFYPPDRAPLDHRGRSLLMVGLSSEREYYTPFFMSSHGYGFFLNSLVKSFWDLAKRDKGNWSIEIDEPRLDFYLIAGPGLKKILERYTEITGRAPLMPKWVLGGRVHAEVQGIL
ncbi:hypothetical protein ACFLT7_08370, partial [candidate division KSB1 bacterium]